MRLLLKRLSCSSPPPGSGVQQIPLPFSPFCCGWDFDMTFMIVFGTEITDAVLISATEQLHHLLMARADVFLKTCTCFHKPVFPQGRYIIVRLEVRLTIWSQTLQTGLGGFRFAQKAICSSCKVWFFRSEVLTRIPQCVHFYIAFTVIHSYSGYPSQI